MFRNSKGATRVQPQAPHRQAEFLHCNCLQESRKSIPANLNITLLLGAVPSGGENTRKLWPYLNGDLHARPGNPMVRLQAALSQIGTRNPEQARKMLKEIVNGTLSFLDAHIILAQVSDPLRMK